MPGSPSQHTTSIELDADMQARVQRLADASRRSAASLIGEAITQYVAREEQQAQFRTDAQAAWEHYETTGLHATGEEVDGWLARLEAGEDADPPECHR